MVTQILLQIGAEGADIGHFAQVKHRRFISVLLVPLVNFLMARVHIGLQQFGLNQPLLLLLVKKMDAGGIDVQAALNATTAGGRHPAPVFKRIRDQRPGGDRGDSVIPVAHFYRRQADINNRAIGAVFWHLQPVAEFEHVVGGKLDPGHQAKNRVFKY